MKYFSGSWFIALLALGAFGLGQPASASGPVRVGLYVGKGASSRGRGNVYDVLTRCYSNEVKVHNITNSKSLSLENVDVVFLPGGMAKTQMKHLSATKIKGFVSSGGGYVGICAGAFNAARLGFAPNYMKHFAWKGDGFQNQVVHSTVSDKVLNETLFYANGPFFPGTLPPSGHGKLYKEPKPILKVANLKSSWLYTINGMTTNKPSIKHVYTRTRGKTIALSTKVGKGIAVASTVHPETRVQFEIQDQKIESFTPLGGPGESASPCGSFQAKLIFEYVMTAARRL